MEAEELSYRLSFGETGSPDVSFRRQVSHSPTNSNASTPEPKRRPKPKSPRSLASPRCSGEFRMSSSLGMDSRMSSSVDSKMSCSLDSVEFFVSAPQSPRSPNGKSPRASPRSPSAKTVHETQPIPPFTKILHSPDTPLPVPCVEVDEDSSRSSRSNGASDSDMPKLKRSGTYDLLDQKGLNTDDEEDSIGRDSREEDSLADDISQQTDL